ncbi:MAG TPA: NAD-dependent epimerase/dehydratase family protein [Rhizobacter sp.]|nr:NAD-dependent epimerase/dehydratase family protein [Rhizobacter sp.]
MKLLILGGTLFLGRHLTEAALAQGHEVTLLNRGRRNPGLFASRVVSLTGDREADMSALRGQRFDAVIDCSGQTPTHVARAVEALGADVPHYLFVSTISVGASFPPGVRYDENLPLCAGHEGYGALKARAEEAIQAALPGRVAVVRPGLIVGPFDPTGRFTYWPRRVARGGQVLAPGRPERTVQFIDARDLAAWCLRLAAAHTTGVFNAVGPDITMSQLLDDCRPAGGGDARFTWVDDAALLAMGVAPWTGLPLWLPEADATYGGMLLADNRRALAAGLQLRPVRETARDTLAWAQSLDSDPPTSVATLTPEDEARCLALAAAR